MDRMAFLRNFGAAVGALIFLGGLGWLTYGGEAEEQDEQKKAPTPKQVFRSFCLKY